MHPPFSRIDLISCRNLFIYLNNELQKKITSIFHYALKKGGYLFLGPSENIIEPSEYFKPANKTHRIYKANPAVQKNCRTLPMSLHIIRSSNKSVTGRKIMRSVKSLMHLKISCLMSWSFRLC
jgi:two-component system CheB/CheR fusion protein